MGRPKLPRVSLTCKHCAKTFLVPPHRARKTSYGPRRFCSRKCSIEYNKKTLTGKQLVKRKSRQCEFCSQIFEVPRSHPKQRFCNHSCFAKWNALQQGQTLRQYDRTCPICGNIISPKNRKYCSSKCYGKALQGQSVHNTISQEDLIAELQRVALVLGHNPTRDEFEKVSKYSRMPYRRIYGTWVKAKEAILGVSAVRLAGKDHPNWRGGWFPYYGPSWYPQRYKARERDKVCQCCSKTPDENGQALDIHHIIPFIEFGIERHEEANALSNLIGLCLECHPKAEKEYRQNCK